MEEHIIADKTLIRTAKVISAVFTPFSIPFLAFLVLFYILVPAHHAVAVQVDSIGRGVLLHHPDAYTDYLHLPQNQRFQSGRTGGTKKEIHSLYSDHHFLCILPAHDAPAQYPVVYDRHHTLRSGNDDNLRHCQLKMETERTHGRRRSRNWRTGSFQCLVQLQSRMVAIKPFILVAGVLGTARIILRHHTLGEVMGGFAVGLLCSLLVLHPLSNILFRIFLF